MNNKITIAVPKGRIMQEVAPIFAKINLIPEADFYNQNSRKIIFSTNQNIDLLQVRSFDVANFVQFGGADLGICGFDVLQEFNSLEIYRFLFFFLSLDA